MKERLGPNILSKLFFILIVLFSLSPFGSSAMALLAGIILASTLENPFKDFTQKHTSTLLQISVVGLGAGMNLLVVSAVGIQGIGYTITGIVLINFLLSLQLELGFVEEVPLRLRGQSLRPIMKRCRFLWE